MPARPLIIDCDPGVDDAVALMLALSSPELDVVAITTVGGNVSAARTARNGRMLAQIAGRPDVPVFKGAERPLVRDPAGAGEFHGLEGLGDLEPFEPDVPCAEGSSAEAIVRMAREVEVGGLDIAVLGPMTNLALALQAAPDIVEQIGSVAVMGGARSEGGNITASAEFNIWADPDAAAQVLATGVEVVMFGLDVTHKVRSTEARIAALEALGTERAATAAAMMRFSQRIEREIVGWPDPPLHDPCPIAWLIQPDLFNVEPCRIRVETQSDLTRGHTAVEFRRAMAGGELPDLWATDVDADGVFALLEERLA